MMRPIFLEGEKVYLSPLSTEDDLTTYASWLNDKDVTNYLACGMFPTTTEQLKDYIKSFQNNKTGMLLGIFLKKNSKHIGNTTLHQINWKDRNAQIGILIGDKKSWGKGYGTEVFRLIRDYAFKRLNLHRIYSALVVENKGSLNALKKVGYEVEGIARDHFFLNGRYVDCLYVAVVNSDSRNK
ncbi:MAG: GNAT family protein [Candidatus Omnitrophica bacterium]|nr:GNAT family protein [Candidatus Omnitrophota bacterium]